MKYINEALALFKDTFLLWKERSPFNNSIIIAYYTIFSLPGLLIIIINIASNLYAREEVTSQITSQIQSVMGGDTAKDIESMVSKAGEKQSTVISSIISFAILLFGATGVFYELQQMLNAIWNIQPKKTHTKQKIILHIRDRIFSFGLILVVGFLLLVSLVLSAGLSAISHWVAVNWSEPLNNLFRVIDIVVSVGIITLLFAAIFKFLPDAKVPWKGVWMGAFLTAFLFVIAKFILGFYFGQGNLSSVYGAAGSVILIMLWVSYTGLILLFGAEFTYVYIHRYKLIQEPAQKKTEDFTQSQKPLV